jgi:hypothetical protein
LTQNLSWHADYVLALAADEAHADLTGWVTLDNQTGTSFPAAQLQLVAGNVQRVQPDAREELQALQDSARLGGAHSELQAAPLFEYHLYRLERPTDVLASERKQVQLLEARGVSVERKLVVRGGARVPRSGASGQRVPVTVLAVLDNREAAGLGVPLPRGVLRVYRADASGAQQFVGEDAVDHTPRDEKLEIELGEAFDVVAEQRRLSQRQPERCASESEWRTDLRNHKDAAVVVEVVEATLGAGQLVESTHPAQGGDATQFTFRVPVPARGASELRYRLRVRTCP